MAVASVRIRFGKFRVGLMAALLCTAGGGRAQEAVERSGGDPATEAVRTALARHLGSPDARVTGLRTGTGGVLCGSVDVRNRMGAFTGPRPFVLDPATGVIGRLPEGPELRNPASVADYHAMERVKALFAAHCIDR